MLKNKISLRGQNFERIINKGYVYVDKTDLVFKLVTTEKFNFLSRPRRFGKSLLLSTVKSYFEGRKDLFKGLKIESLEKEWKKYPVLRFDLNSGIYQNEEGVAHYLSFLISEYEAEYHISNVNTNEDFVKRFKRLIKAVFEHTDCEVVILIDEYEKPLLDTIQELELQKRHRDYLKLFYAALQDMEESIRFVLLTGVTHVGQKCTFSDFNSIRDLSLDPEYATICGFTQEELTQNYSPFISELCQKLGWNYNQAFEELRQKYDGYRFSEKDIKVYNPYTLLNCFITKELDNFWFSSGSPSFLFDVLRKHRFPIGKLVGYEASKEMLSEGNDNFTSPISLFYQGGYLTIVNFFKENKQKKYILDFPNEEVRHGLCVNALRYYSQDRYLNVDSVIDKIVEDSHPGNAKDMIDQIGSVIMALPYSPRENYEFFYQDAVAVIFFLLGIKIHVELKMLTGVVDCVIEDTEYVYIIEFKVDKTPQEAIDQIHKKRYDVPFIGSRKKIIRIGVNFYTDTRFYDYIIED